MGLKNPLYLLIFPRLCTSHLFHSSVLPQVGEAVILVWNFVLYQSLFVFPKPLLSLNILLLWIQHVAASIKDLFAIRHGKLIRITEFSFWFFACSRKCRWYICHENRCEELARHVTRHRLSHILENWIFGIGKLYIEVFLAYIVARRVHPSMAESLAANFRKRFEAFSHLFLSLGPSS